MHYNSADFLNFSVRDLFFAKKSEKISKHSLQNFQTMLYYVSVAPESGINRVV